MDIDKLIRKITSAEYEYKSTISGHRESWKTKAVSTDEGAREAVCAAIYEWAAEEITDIDTRKRIAELEAKCYTYEKVIANSNFAPVAETALGYCQKIYNLDTPEEVANKIARVKPNSVAEIIGELQALEGGTE